MEPSLWGLLVSSFVSSTILPGNSEIVLVSVIKLSHVSPAIAILVATLGNTVGGMTTYGLGRMLPDRLREGPAVARMRRYGPAALLLSWVPLVGDALCAAAGWLKLPWIPCTLAMAAGKLARYALLAQAVAWVP